LCTLRGDREGMLSSIILLPQAAGHHQGKHGGRVGKGIRVVCHMSDLVLYFNFTSSKALALFRDGSMFVERHLDHFYHIKMQIIGDVKGNVIHIWEWDCWVQRKRHQQKIIETAPAKNVVRILQAGKDLWC
jgi:pyruvate carboxylase